MNIRIPWHILGLMAVLAAAVVAAVLELGPPSRSTRTSTEVVTAARGVVTSTVTGTGNVEAGTDVEANFQTSGTLQNIYVKDGDHVVKGQLLATLDPTAAQLTVDQAQESLTSAQDNLTNAEAQTATSGASSSGTSGSATSASVENVPASTQFVTFHPTQTTTTQTTTATTPAPTTPTRTSSTPTTTTAPTTTPSRAGSGGGSGGSSGSGGSGGGSGSGSRGASAGGSGGGSGSGSRSSSSGSSSSGSGQTSTTSAATIAANIASAQASVDGAEATLKNAENALHQTHLYAPATGTVVNVSDVSPGDTVSAGGAGSGSGSGSNASSGSSSGSGSGSGSGSTAGSLNGSSSSSSSSSSSGLVEIVNTHAMTMTVSFSESDISKIKVGQRANVTLDALSGVELSAHVSSISTLGTSSSGVVSYDATITLDQHDSRVKPGMSASAAVITGQATGVNLPNSAVTSAGSVARVDLLRNGKVVPTTVVTGLVGDSRTQIVSGLKAGDQVQVTTTLPALGSGSSSSSPTGSSGTLGGAGLGRGARIFGGGGGFAVGGGGFRGGG